MVIWCWTWVLRVWMEEGRKEMFYLMTYSTHVIYGYMVSDIKDHSAREETCCHMGYSFWLTARVSTYHSLCYTRRGALVGTRNSSMGPPHEGSIRRPIAPWANALTTELDLAPQVNRTMRFKRMDVILGYITAWAWEAKRLSCTKFYAHKTHKSIFHTVIL